MPGSGLPAPTVGANLLTEAMSSSTFTDKRRRLGSTFTYRNPQSFLLNKNGSCITASDEAGPSKPSSALGAKADVKISASTLREYETLVKSVLQLKAEVRNERSKVTPTVGKGFSHLTERSERAYPPQVQQHSLSDWSLRTVRPDIAQALRTIRYVYSPASHPERAAR